ncbi:hypothetical protein SAMN05421788_107238 [Filimonas lacunae]|uniref:Uncharacterized protein n=1 Tax=Filimonas lacunae TaxID=477680 RepID=A0A173MG57_9BACT|nr:hypothetical protein [Filimonas lacunae]BAV06575.1 hypothetical protein FLA_2594 [Filimonas lacunae]SIT27448.1 hypothetical protein SAMN05421788_107238 [Filimonas lacunae]
MKKYKDFIPKSDAELAVYAFGYKTNFRKMATLAIPHLTNDDIETHEAEVQHMIDLIYKIDIKKAELAGLVSEKNQAVSETVAKIRRMATYAKNGEARDSPEVAAAGLKCQAIRLELRDLRPTLTIKSNYDFIEIAFNKHHVLPIAIYSRKSGVAEWEFVSYATTSPYIDKRPPAIPGQPERREYQANYTDYQSCISQKSGIVSTVLMGGLKVIQPD